MTTAQRLRELGIELPAAYAPAGAYSHCRIVEQWCYVSGHGPTDGDILVRGRVGADLDLEAARHAARLTGLAILATLSRTLGDLDRIEQIVKVFGMVNVAPGFDQLPAVIDGCSTLLLDVFGDRGRHARSAVGVAQLPFGIPVEIELVARLTS
jgi:enamine deaminase RidA (YjgF/YER057c/UK114 family)